MNTKTILFIVLFSLYLLSFLLIKNKLLTCEQR